MCAPPVQAGFVNALAFASSGKFLLAGTGQVGPYSFCLLSLNLAFSNEFKEHGSGISV
jgi:hypothetical protein